MGAISAIKRTGRNDGTPARCRAGKTEQAAIRTCHTPADGFLRHQFLPLYKPSVMLPDKRKVEKQLLRSLSRLAGAHGFTPIQVDDKPYPYNLLLSFWHAREILRCEAKDMTLWIDMPDNGQAAFATTDTVDTGATLFYIPVIPLYELLQNRGTRAGGTLLLSVCSYLCRIAGISYYRQDDTYLYWHYEMLAEWM